MFAIINKRTKKWVYGTDYRVSPPTQRTSKQQALLFSERWLAEGQLKYRCCGKDYKVVEVELKQVM